MGNNSQNISFQKHKAGTFDKIKTFFKIRKIEKILQKEKKYFDKIDNENIDCILNNKQNFSNNRPIPYPKVQNPKISDMDLVDTTLKFFDSIDGDIGKRMRQIYQTHKNEIFISFKSGTGNVSFPKVTDLGNGKKGVCAIERDGTYLDYFNTAHEFMHLLTFALGKNNEKLNDVQARFIEMLLADYLVKEKIITIQDRKDHIDANNDRYIDDEIHRVSNYRDVKKCFKQNNGKLLYNELLYGYCMGDEAKFVSLVDRLEKDIRIPKGTLHSLENKLRFIHATCGSKKLYEMYNSTGEQDPTRISNPAFLKKYKQILLGNSAIYKYDWENFFEEIEKYDEQDEEVSTDSQTKQLEQSREDEKY